MRSDSQIQVIEDAVLLLAQLAPDRLVSLRETYPALAEELQGSVYATPENADVIRATDRLEANANVMRVALDEISIRAEAAMTGVGQKIKRARYGRLFAQVMVIVGSSSLLGTVAMDKKAIAVISAVLTLVAALGNVVAEYHERLLTPKIGDIYDAFQKLGESRYRARILGEQLRLGIEYHQPPNEMRALLKQANDLCEQMNRWLIQLVQHLDQAEQAKETFGSNKRDEVQIVR